MDSACHVIKRMSNPRLNLGQMASYAVASYDVAYYDGIL